MSKTPKIILLHQSDTILVCTSPILAGEAIEIDGVRVAAPEAIGVGHKIARRSLEAGDKVVKYGAPIGSIVTAAPIGGWVHLHNMKSDYIATHSRETVSREER